MIFHNNKSIDLPNQKYYINCKKMAKNKITSGLIKCDESPYFKKNGENYWTYIHNPEDKHIVFSKHENVKYSPYEDDSGRYMFNSLNSLEESELTKLQEISEAIKFIEKINVNNDYNIDMSITEISLNYKLRQERFIHLLEYLLKHLCNFVQQLSIEPPIKKVIFDDLRKMYSFVNDDFEVVSTQINEFNATKNKERYEKLSSLNNEDDKGNNDMLTREAFRSLNLGVMFDQNHPTINPNVDESTSIIENENVEGDLFNDEIDQSDYANDFEADDI